MKDDSFAEWGIGLGLILLAALGAWIWKACKGAKAEQEKSSRHAPAAAGEAQANDRKMLELLEALAKFIKNS